MIDLKAIRSLTDFQRHAKEYIAQMKQEKTPVVLTVNGKAELVVQDVQSYQEMLERLDRVEAVEAIRRAMDEFERGEGQPAREALEELRQKHGIPR
jgi:prevent-host-death family protein